jgi:glycosyltransferase involved in cell wall biosynthesis
MLSVILITRNEAHNLEDCLASLHGLADEIVVVDAQSSDATVSIAQRYGAKVAQTYDWPGFGPQKNRALALATQPWVLSIDADERVTPELAAEINLVIRAANQDGNHTGSAKKHYTAYEIPRQSWYCGKFIQHCGWHPDYVLRLFRKDTAKFSDDLVHERVITTEASGQIKNYLLHFSYLDFSQVLIKIDAYSSAAAQQAFSRGDRGSLCKALLHGAWAFFRTYVLRAGFFDGAHGLALSISNAQTSYYKYVKLWLKGQQANTTIE